MGFLANEIGRRYGNLLVIGRAENKGTRAAWLCQCDCGKYTTVEGKKLRNGHTQSCGCYRKKTAAAQGKSNKISEIEVHRRCLENGFELLSEYRGIKNTALFRCTSCGYEVKRRAESTIYGLWGCVRCSTQDYDFHRKARIEEDEEYANKSATVYLFHLIGNGEDFYKIGFTSMPVKERLRKIPYVLADIDVVATTVKRAYELEGQLKRAIRAYRYKPLIDFHGSGECFQPNTARAR